MKIEELRIGNYVDYWGAPCPLYIKSIEYNFKKKEYEIWCKDNNDDTCVLLSLKELEAFKLDDLLLKKLGFVYNDIKRKFEKQFVTFDNRLLTVEVCGCNTTMFIRQGEGFLNFFAGNVIYLHQLQNYAEDNDIKLEVKL